MASTGLFDQKIFDIYDGFLIIAHSWKESLVFKIFISLLYIDL